MVKHMILWKLKEEISAGERAERIAEAKARLESLVGKVPGLLFLTVHTGALPSSTADMMLDSTFTDEETLAAYQKNPLHVEAATYVRSIVGQRLCLDFEGAAE